MSQEIVEPVHRFPYVLCSWSSQSQCLYHSWFFRETEPRVYIYLSIYREIYTHTHMLYHLHIYVCTVCVCIYIYIYTHTHTYCVTYIYMYVCVCVCVYTHRERERERERFIFRNWLKRCDWGAGSSEICRAGRQSENSKLMLQS